VQPLAGGVVEMTARSKRKPLAWCVTHEGQAAIYDTKSEAMFWGDFIAGYSASPVMVTALHAGRSRKFAPKGKKRRGPMKVWIPKVMW